MTLLNTTWRLLSSNQNPPSRRTDELYAAQSAQHVLDLFSNHDTPTWEILAHILTLETKACRILADDTLPHKAQLLDAVAERRDPAITQAVERKLKLSLTDEPQAHIRIAQFGL